MTTAELAGIAHEFAFWKGFIETPRFRNDFLSETPNPSLHETVRDFLLARPDARVLDVGSGVIGLLRGTVPADKLTCVDPLGGLYATIFDYAAHGIVPPAAIPVESLDYVEAFDVAHMSNALDHCQDPVTAMARLERATKPGGWVIVQGFVREGTRQNWQGFHQWDIDTDRGHLVCESRAGGRLSLGEGIALGVDRPLGPWFIWMRQKPGPEPAKRPPLAVK